MTLKDGENSWKTLPVIKLKLIETKLPVFLLL